MAEYVNVAVCRVSCLAVLVIMILSLLLYCEFSKVETIHEPNSLRLLHVIFRNGQSEPPYDEKLQEVPYKKGRLSMNGRTTMYQLGKELRKYYRHFMGDSYEAEHLEAITAKGNVAEESMQTVLAALYPPTGAIIWLGGLNWQPIPYSITNNSDTLLSFPPDSCPKWNDYYNETLKNNKIINITQESRNYFQLLSNHTGWEENFMSAYKFNYNIDLGLKVPDWATEIYPEPTRSLSNSFLNLASSSEEMKKITAGNLLWKILEDTKDKLDIISAKKIHLYSSEDYTLFFLARALRLNVSKISRKGSYLAIEIHEIDNNYFIQFVYAEEVGEKREILDIPYCGKLCPMQFFYDKNKKYMPTSDMCIKS